MRLRLQVFRPGHAAGIFEHEGPEIQIGRDPGCELSMNEHTISTVHAEIQLTSEGAILLDRESLNGTFLNDRLLETERFLKVGDHIRLGQCGPILQVQDIDLHVPARPRMDLLEPEEVPEPRERVQESEEIPEPREPVQEQPRPRAPVPVRPAEPATAETAPVPEPRVVISPAPRVAHEAPTLVSWQKEHQRILVAAGAVLLLVMLLSIWFSLPGKTATITGAVYYGGVPLLDGVVVFSQDGYKRVKVPIDNGIYKATGIPFGTVQVYLYSQESGEPPLPLNPPAGGNARKSKGKDQDPGQNNTKGLPHYRHVLDVHEAIMTHNIKLEAKKGAEAVRR